MLDIIEDYLETVNVFKGSDVSLGDLDYVDEATAEFLLFKLKRELKRLPQFLEISKKSKKRNYEWLIWRKIEIFYLQVIVIIWTN